MVESIATYYLVTGGATILACVFAAFMFAAAIWKPASIQSVTVFRRAVILFAFSLLLPPIAELLLTISGESLRAAQLYGSYPSYSTQSAKQRSSIALCVPVIFASGKIFFAFSVALGILSVVRKSHFERKIPSVSNPFDATDALRADGPSAPAE